MDKKDASNVEKKAIKAAGKTAGSMLMNWPPSRGRMPAWMSAEPKYIIPKIQIKELPADAPLPIPVISLPKILKLSKAHLKDLKKRGKTARDMIDPIESRRDFSYHVWVQVSDVLTLTARQADAVITGSLGNSKADKLIGNWGADNVLPVRTYIVDIRYPLSKTARVTIEPYTWKLKRSDGTVLVRKRMSLGYLLWQIAQAYKIIYRQHKRWGVWGHAIGDLGFEGLEISDNISRVHIGS